MAKGPVKIGFSAMAIPLSRGEMDYAMELSKKMGITPVDKEVIPPPTADYTPFATKLKDAGPNWVLFLGAVGDAGANAGSAAQAWLAGRLHRLGPSRSGGRAGAAEGRKFYVVNSNSLFQEACRSTRRSKRPRRRPARNIRRRP